jgi:hypothetical protein
VLLGLRRRTAQQMQTEADREEDELGELHKHRLPKTPG